MNDFVASIKSSVNTFNKPFKHWEMEKPLNDEVINEINSVEIPDGNRVYDGTRAADKSGNGVDGKLRVFLNKNNKDFYPHLTSLIQTLQSKECYKILEDYLNKELDKEKSISINEKKFYE